MTFKCTRCGDEFETQEVAEWILDREPFSMKPFVCPDCFDKLTRLDLENQLKELIREAEEITRKEAEPWTQIEQ